MGKTYVQLVNDYMKEDIYRFNSDRLQQMRNELLVSVFKFHFDNCEPYRKYCEAKGVDPSQIASIDDVYKIPLLDGRSTLRKRQFFSVPNNEIISNFSSTGSSGKPIIWIGVDQISLDWMIKATHQYISEFMPIKPGISLLMVPGLPQLKFPYLVNKVLSMMNQKIYFGLKARFRRKSPKPEITPDLNAIREFAESDANGKNLIGFPFAFLSIRDMMKQQNISYNPGAEGCLITGGGWKPRDPSNIYGKLPRVELEQELSKIFSIPKENIRDVYGATELVLACPECVHNVNGKTEKVLHIPPWSYAYTVDPDTFEQLSRGKPGVGVFIDFLSRSYPSFILTDDIIAIKGEDCPCGRAGQTFAYVERVSELEERGCAFKIQDQLFSEEYLHVAAKTTYMEQDGLIDYLVKNQLRVSGGALKNYEDVFKKIMRNMIGAISFQVEDEKAIPTLTVSKLLCYSQGRPTFKTLDEIGQEAPEISREDLTSILEKLVEHKYVGTTTEEGKEKYYLTKMGDSFGDAFFHMLIWALKYL